MYAASLTLLLQKERFCLSVQNSVCFSNYVGYVPVLSQVVRYGHTEVFDSFHRVQGYPSKMVQIGNVFAVFPGKQHQVADAPIC